MLSDNIYLWLHRHLETEGEIALTTVDEELDSDGQSFAREYLDRLTRDSVLAVTNDVYTILDHEAERKAYYRLLDSTDADYDRPDDLSYQPVLSVPSKLQNDWEEYARDNGISPGIGVRSALQTVIADAEESLLIVAPFIETDGMNLLTDPFTAAAQRGVALKILVRDVLGDEPRSYGENNRRKAIAEAIDRYESVGSAEASITVRSFHHEIGDEYSKLDRSIHAKIVVADTKTAYVGSGEIRDSSMNLNGEGGYLTGNPDDIAQWRVFFEFFWERAEDVSRANLS